MRGRKTILTSAKRRSASSTLKWYARIFCVNVILQWTEKQHKEHDLTHKSEVGICPCLAFSQRAAKVCAAAAVNAFAARWESFVSGKLPGLPTAKQDVQLANSLIPISTTCSPVFDNFRRCQIQHFAQGIIIGKGRLVLGDPPELPVKSLDDIGRIYDFPNLGWICKECG